MNQTLINPNLDYKEQAKKIFENLDVSETTRQDYQYRIGLFADFVISRGFNRNTFLEFKRYLANRSNVSVSTKNKYLVSAKIFLKELNRTGRMQTDITQNVKTFTQSKKHKKDGLNDEEMRLLTDMLHQLPPTPKTARLKAIIALLALQGLRQIEIIRLDVADLDLVNKMALVQGKGQDDKERIDLHPETVKALREYIKSNKVADGPLFRSRSNNSQNNRLTTRGLRGIVKQVLDELNIDKSTHGFRHFFTTALIKNYNGDLLEVAGYTRHKCLEMLQVYNDNVKRKADLPRYYTTFDNVKLS